ncbi:acetyl/propionyl/methylcrotonyl-CoA carboxylase subunit alpha [Dactylosporangium sp. CA-233914]|uniref:acetyl/propionyl/methylcrotonyl-CoA carboxylase subunit alpha n=1 Tax=Dactylosporangium sp. CA-233914 TaxID=3239934 RepID=UPI003D8E8FB7
MPTPHFQTLLVANRGEIALRVIRAARASGLRTVAVYSDADAQAQHVLAADTAVRIGPAPAAESYLNIAALLEAARRSGADAVHPGYGFLSERSAFARACTDAGLTFVGPPADVIDLLGRKDSARRVAIAAGVPVIPAVEASGGPGLARRALDEIGLPLLVKAAAGGGGKGMRIVRTAAELPDALAAAKREAAAAFGDDTVLIERYVERGRHVEVQIIADHHGSVLHLFERDCSSQRRHQKVLEEAPAPKISRQVRDTVTAAAIALARQAGYTNAGTVEFLVDGEAAYLLEMNTRLQVEHPVTELITGRDLVDLQLRVAQGDPLPFTQNDVTATGHAIEVRVYAEDPDNGFLPQAGTATAVRWPARARVDAGLVSGQAVGTFYDPMLGKIIVHGHTREAARTALMAALDETVILGLTTNVGFLRRLAGSDAFRDAEIDTGWLDRNIDALPTSDSALAICAAAWSLIGGPPARSGSGPFDVPDGWRIGGTAAPVVVSFEHGTSTRLAIVDRTNGMVTAGEHSWSVLEMQRCGPDHDGLTDLVLQIDGVVERFILSTAPPVVTVTHNASVTALRCSDRAAAPIQAISDGHVVAPMPGSISVVNVAETAVVATGEILGILEAMKMELALRAPFDGIVTLVNAAVGDQVSLGKRLFVVTPDPGGS